MYCRLIKNPTHRVRCRQRVALAPQSVPVGTFPNFLVCQARWLQLFRFLHPACATVGHGQCALFSELGAYPSLASQSFVGTEKKKNK